MPRPTHLGIAPRRVLAITALGILLAFAVPAFAESPPQPATEAKQFPTVEVSAADSGNKFEGKWKVSAVTLKTKTGTATFNIEHVRRITLQKDAEGHPHDLVELNDKSLVHGELVAEQFLLQTNSGDISLARGTVREIRVLRDVPLSLVAIILGLLTLTAMEIILGVDNVIFLAIIAGKLPKEQQPRARKIGLAAALGTRLLLLFSLSFLLGLTTPVFTLPSLGFLTDMDAREVSWRDIILLAGGLFLIGKSTLEMHEKLEAAKRDRDGTSETTPPKPVSFAKTIFTIAVIDIVFSLDSVITAVGMVDTLWVMVTAMVIAMVVMVYFAGSIADFVDKHPTVKVLALSFLILIGVMLVAEGLGQHIDKGYIYTAMAFSVVVEMINMKLRKPKKKPEPAAP